MYRKKHTPSYKKCNENDKSTPVVNFSNMLTYFQLLHVQMLWHSTYFTPTINISKSTHNKNLFPTCGLKHTTRGPHVTRRSIFAARDLFYKKEKLRLMIM